MSEFNNFIVDVSTRIDTPNVFDYKPALDLAGVTAVRFTVQACNDAHITLQPTSGTIIRYTSYH